MKNEENLGRIRFLESERVFLTPRTMAEFDEHYRWDHDREMVYFDAMPYRPKNYEKAKEEYEKLLKDDKAMSFSVIIKESGANAGLVAVYGINDYEHRCIWGIALTAEYRHQGIGTECALLVLDYVFNELGFRRLKSFTHSGNIPSMRFQEKLGFVKEGVMRQESFCGGAYVDSIHYAMMKGEYEARYGKPQIR